MSEENSEDTAGMCEPDGMQGARSAATKTYQVNRRGSEQRATPQTAGTAIPAAFSWPVRVYWEDTDAGGVVYYANYLKFLERARSEWLRALAIHQAELAAEEDVLFVVRRVEADYLRPARFDDALAVQCRITEMGRASLTMAQQVLRGGEVLLSAQVKLACVSASAMRPAKIPPHLYAKLNNA